MDAEQIKQTYGHLTLNDLPEEVRAEVSAQPELAQWFRDMESVQMLVSLKRFESAPEAALGRCQHRVITRLQNEPADQDVPASGRWLGWALGTAAVLLIAMNFAYRALGPTTPEAPAIAIHEPGIPIPSEGIPADPGFATVGNFNLQPDGDDLVLTPTHTNRPATLRLNQHEPDPARQGFQFIVNPSKPKQP